MFVFGLAQPTSPPPLQVSSVSLVIPGEMDLDKINYTLGALLQMRGEDIFRMKGILAIQHSEFRWVAGFACWCGVLGAM